MAESKGNSGSTYGSEYSGSDSCSSSCCTDSESVYFPWLEYVKADGSLFYIEQDISSVSLEESSVANPYHDNFSLQQSEQTKSKLNSTQKLKKWLKRRKKKMRKSFPLLKSNKSSVNTNPDSSWGSSSLLSAISKEVCIDINSSKHASNSSNILTEELLGLKIGLLDDVHEIPLEGKIKLLGFLPGREIPDVKIGDYLKSINDIDVNFSNIDDVLSNIASPSKVKLTFLSLSSKGISRLHCTQPNADYIIKELLGESDLLEEASSQSLYIPHGLFYLSTDEEFSNNDGTIYRYPDHDTPLYNLKGMLITIAHMISDVASPPLLSCSISVQGEIVHVGFLQDASELMIFALPASCATISEVQQFTIGFSKLLKFQYSSLKRTFTDKSQEKSLNQLVILFFKHCLSSIHYGSNFSQPHLLEILPSVHWIPLPADLKTEIDDILSELESADFGSSSDGFDENRRIYSILGSCLFYKGYLLSSHLPRNDLLDIYSFLCYRHILTLTKEQMLSQIIIWQQVYPSRHQETSFSDPKFEEVQGRWFMLIVAMHHSVLAVFLEDGGCAMKVGDFPQPEPFYVEEVQNTLIILQDCGIIKAVEKMLYFCLPPVASPDLYLKGNTSTRNSLFSLFTTSNSHNSPNSAINSFGYPVHHSTPLYDSGVSRKPSEDALIGRPDITDAERQQLLSAMGPADGESDTDSSYSDESSDNLHEKRSRSYSTSTGSTSESRGSNEHVNSQGHISRKIPSHAECENQFWGKPFRLVSGSENTLFHYLHMDPVEGVFLAPIYDDSSLLQGSVLKDILDTFYRCCLNMRVVFERSLRNAEITKAGIATTCGINSFLNTVYEQGVLFQYNQKDFTKQKSSRGTLNFWVIGRLFFAPEPREVYVCYHDSAQQDLVEMAFRLGFGISL